MKKTSAISFNTIQDAFDKVKDVAEKNKSSATRTGLPNGVNVASLNQPDYLHVFDSRTWKIHDIPVSDGFVRASDLSTITAPTPGEDGRVRKLAVLDPGFQHTACKESSITLM